VHVPHRPEPRRPVRGGLILSRTQTVFAILGAFFLTNAVIAEVVGGKVSWVVPEGVGLFGNRLMASVGVLMWPVVFVTTDLVNEYFGKRGVRRLTLLTVVMIAYAFVVLYFAQLMPTATGADGNAIGVDAASFNEVFGTSRWIIVGSMTAFAVSQLIDVAVFHAFRRRTGRAMLWLRATGSTLVSQLIDSLIVLYIGLAVPFGWTAAQFWTTAISNYAIKIVIAILMTPLIYLVHGIIDRYLGEEVAERLAESAAKGQVVVP
jgi:queuosine precursor transporter